jgi:uncharacterized protein Yka (UPF0111/DUF47 family)
MVRFSLIPRQEEFFSDFVQLSKQIQLGAGTLKRMLATEPPELSHAQAIKDLEHVCDTQTRSIIDRLNRTFVTPLDREDIHSLAV